MLCAGGGGEGVSCLLLGSLVNTGVCNGDTKTAALRERNEKNLNCKSRSERDTEGDKAEGKGRAQLLGD